MKKIFVFGSILVLALLLTSCVLFQKPLVLNYTGPADGLELVGPNNIKLTWESSIEKFQGEIKHDVLFGTDQENLEKIAEDITAKEYVIDVSNFEFDQTYYWQIIAKAEKRDPEIGEIRSITVKDADIVVKKYQGGYLLNDILYEMDEEDLIIRKEGFSTARIQNFDRTIKYEVPLREIINPNWTYVPKLIIEGLTAGETYSENLVFDLEVETDKNEAFVYYVYLGSEGRGPNQYIGGTALGGTNEAEVTINTKNFPDEETYIRILAYTNNDDLVLTIIPIIINNEATHTELPGAVPALNAWSITLSQVFSYYSDPANPNLNGDIYEMETPFGKTEFDINSFTENMTVYNVVQWAAATDATGYRVLRSFDGDNWRQIGITIAGQTTFNDFSSELDVGKEVYYKVIPYNSFGDNDDPAVVRWLVPLPSLEVNLISPDNKSKVNTEPLFTWSIDFKGNDRMDWDILDDEDIDVEFISYLHVFDLNNWKIYDEELEFDLGDTLEFQLPEGILNSGNIYSWDIYDAELFVIYEWVADGYSYSWSHTWGDGSANGENIFTTSPGEEYTEESVLPDLAFFKYSNQEFQQEHILVKSFNTYELGRTLRNYNSEILTTWNEIGWSKVKVPAGETVESFIAKLIKENNIVFAQPDFKMELPVTSLDKMIQIEESDHEVGETVDMYKLWGLENIKAEEAWEITTGSENVILAIIDTGVDINHPEFENNTIMTPFDGTGESDATVDLDGHGTHVAGTAGAYGRDGKIAGVAWDSPIWPMRVMNDSGAIWTTYLINATRETGNYAKDNPDKRVVINMSIGGRGYNFAFKDAIDYAMGEGVVFVTSAGNDYKRIPSYPTSYNGVIAVAATNPTNGKADFSTIGPWTSVGAPGVSIYSTYPNEGYEWLQGTSMASPHVAGAAALLLSENPTLTPMQVRNQLEQTANNHGRGYTEEFGYGIIDLVEMLGEIKPNQYGSLNVKTNLSDEELSGIIVVWDSEETLVAYGTTGEEGNHIFHALKAGTYTFDITYKLPDLIYITYTDTAVITAEEETEKVVEFLIPEYEETLLITQNIDETEYFKEIPITITEEGLYYFETFELDDPDVDTIMFLFDSEENLIAENDDKASGDYCSLIAIKLIPGEYKIRIEEWFEDPLNCKFEMRKLERQ